MPKITLLIIILLITLLIILIFILNKKLKEYKTNNKKESDNSYQQIKLSILNNKCLECQQFNLENKSCCANCSSKIMVNSLGSNHHHCSQPNHYHHHHNNQPEGIVNYSIALLMFLFISLVFGWKSIKQLL